MDRLRICFVSSEYAPLAKTGGLADVSAALTRYLHGAGHDVRVFLPLYRRVDDGKRRLEAVDHLQEIPVEIGARTHRFSIYRTTAPGSDLPIHLVHSPALYGREEIYTQQEDEHVRFLLLSHAALLTCQRLGFAPEIIHCNDWQTGMVPLFLRTHYAWDRLFAGTRTVLTIHNIGYQGIFGPHIVPDLRLGESSHLLHQADLQKGQVGFLKTGLLYADGLTTVSPTYAREIQSEEHGMGMEEILRARSERLVGILNGVDYAEWDPTLDPLIPHRYSVDDLSGKGRNREALLRGVGLPGSPVAPVVGMVTRLTAQKGLELVEKVLPEVLRERDLRLVVLGSGEQRFEEFFRKMRRTFPGKVHFHNGFSNELAHLIEAGADAFLMPSQYEPCGLNQMYSLRYGTIPIVRKTGGLADTVDLYDPETGEGTGIVFEHYTSAGLRWAILATLDLYKNRKVWEKMVRSGMARDFSWEKQGAVYVDLYRRLLTAPKY